MAAAAVMNGTPPSHDVLVLGAGLAGMRAAIEAHDAGADVALLSKIHPVRSHSGACGVRKSVWLLEDPSELTLRP